MASNKAVFELPASSAGARWALSTGSAGGQEVGGRLTHASLSNSFFSLCTLSTLYGLIACPLSAVVDRFHVFSSSIVLYTVVVWWDLVCFLSRYGLS